MEKLLGISIVHGTTLDMIKIDEDCKYLMLQRNKGRNRKMPGGNEAFSRMELCARAMETLLEKKRKKETAVLSSSRHSSLNEGSSISEEFVADIRQPSTSRQFRLKYKSANHVDS